MSATAIVGGGLAGLAAAFALREQGVPVELFEARRALGGRASSYREASGELVDHCQHVSMGCCTSLSDFCRRAGIEDEFRRYETLHFLGPDGKQYDLAAHKTLPAPLHLLPALMRLGYFSWRNRVQMASALLRLARVKLSSPAAEMRMADWLRAAGQSTQAIEQFWEVVLVSALGETLDRVTVAAARKVFVDGFMTTRAGYQVLVPQLPLGQLYGERLAARLREQGVVLHVNATVSQVLGDARRAIGIRLADGTERQFGSVVLATTWRRVSGLLPDSMDVVREQLAGAEQFESSPITGIHLWFDRPIMSLPHVVLPGRKSHWLFHVGRSVVPQSDVGEAHYYQVVISASRHLIGQPREQLVSQIVEELQAALPDAQAARLLHSRVVTEKHAVFSPLPGSESARPAQLTAIPGLFLAGDWTATGWPATMEGAVRSGYLAAQAVLAEHGQQVSLLPADPQPNFLARWVTRG